MLQKQITLIKSVILGLLLALFPVLSVAAQNSCSSNYCGSEPSFGVGSGNASSTNYSAQGSAGALGVGTGSSANYRSVAGTLTPSDPYLEMIVNASNINLGTLSTGSTATGSGTFSVRTYLSSSYVVLTMSNPPTQESGYSLIGMTSTAAPTPGTEEFGINLVANTSPATFGADPVNIPNNSFADGEASTGYATPNQFKYVVGDTIADSAKTPSNQAAGETDYTISYVANIAPLTKAGLYTMNHDIVVVATF